MIKRTRPLLLCVLLLLACGCAGAGEGGGGGGSGRPATQPAARAGAADADPEAGYQNIFNGRDLTGWTYATGPKGALKKSGAGYQVRPAEAGEEARHAVLYCTAADGGQLFTEKQYADFSLRFDFRLTSGANNGVALRAPLKGQPAYDGLEIQILDDTAEKYAEKLRPAQYHGSVYDLIPSRRGHQKPVGEWNTQEILARGPRITVILNGQTIVDADLSKEVNDEAALKKHPGIHARRGHIGLLGHGSPVEFRNLRIKEF